MKTKKINSKKMGFTLVELLVVLAIIGLLAAIAIPTILGAQRGARNSARLKGLEAVRNATQELLTRTSSATTVINMQEVTVPAAGIQICVNACATATQTTTVPRTVVGGVYTLHLLNVTSGTACGAGGNADFSTGNVANFVYNNAAAARSVTLCTEGGGSSALTFNGGNQ